jgi:hypothetical protein
MSPARIALLGNLPSTSTFLVWVRQKEAVNALWDRLCIRANAFNIVLSFLKKPSCSVIMKLTTNQCWYYKSAHALVSEVAVWINMSKEEEKQAKQRGRVFILAIAAGRSPR